MSNLDETILDDLFCHVNYKHVLAFIPVNTIVYHS